MSKVALILALFLSGGSAWAQAGGSSSGPRDSSFEFGIHTGNLLPNQIGGVTEIMGLGGARMAYLLSPRSYVEGGFIMGNGEGQQWRNLHVDMRIDIPVETLLATAYIGADAIMYKGGGESEKLNFGGHVGGAVQAAMGDSVWFRTDMKFGFSPGTSLYFSVGFVFRAG